MGHQRWRGGQQVDTFPALDDSSLHSNRSVDIVQLEVKSTGVANSVSAAVATPERCGCCPAVGTDEILAVGVLLVEGWTARASVCSSNAIAVSVARTRLCVALGLPCLGSLVCVAIGCVR